MAITNAQLLAEIQNDPAGLGFAGAGANIIAQRLNTQGSALVQAWVVSSTAHPATKESFLQLLSLNEAGAMQALMDGGTVMGNALKLKLNQSTSIDMSKTPNREFIAALEAGGIVTLVTRDAMLRLGEVEQSRAQELWGEPVTVEQIEEVI